jgi:nucleoside-diphosphate kinase
VWSSFSSECDDYRWTAASESQFEYFNWGRSLLGTKAIHVVPAAAMAELASWLGNRSSATAVHTHCAVCVIKPHAVAAGQVGAVLEALLTAGLEVSAIRTLLLSARDAGDYLEAYRDVVPEYSRWLAELASGPSVVLEVRSDGDVVGKLRELAGPYVPEVARELRPDSLRAKLGVDAVRNAVHVTDLSNDGPLESKFLFKVVTADE